MGTGENPALGGVFFWVIPKQTGPVLDWSADETMSVLFPHEGV
jgi:hypothetical protein